MENNMHGGMPMDKKELFDKIEGHLMKDGKPSEYINELLKKEMLDEYPFTMISGLTRTEQNAKYHPEGSVWNHTMLVVDEAAKRKEKSRDSRVFMWAALLHDIGKAPTTRARKGHITSYDHERVGKRMAAEFLRVFGQDEPFIDKVVSLIRWHMEPLFVIKNLPFANVKQLVKEVPVDEIALLCKCDRFGRGEMSEKKMEDEAKGISMFVEICRDAQREMNTESVRK
jgi:putative nucleotidyltransferase with HDIG domain